MVNRQTGIIREVSCHQEEAADVVIVISAVALYECSGFESLYVLKIVFLIRATSWRSRMLAPTVYKDTKGRKEMAEAGEIKNIEERAEEHSISIPSSVVLLRKNLQDRSSEKHIYKSEQENPWGRWGKRSQILGAISKVSGPICTSSV